MDSADFVVPVRLGLDLRNIGRRLRPVSVGRTVQLCGPCDAYTRRAARETIQAKVYDVIRKELHRGRLPFVFPVDLDRIMGDDITKQQINKSLQLLRDRGVIERVPGKRGAVRLRPNAPKALNDQRGRNRGGFARNW